MFALTVMLANALDRKRYFKKIRMARGSILGLHWHIYYSFERSREYVSISIGTKKWEKRIYEGERDNERIQSLEEKE